ncbi:MAG: TlpA family protein disulfide reductase, partial [Actinobacteria bacterium]|nr:TlpA family protein disulfide reductase [Actinomycetota bacterium]
MTEPATRSRITKRWRPFVFGIAALAVVVGVALVTRPDGNDDGVAPVGGRQAPTFAVADLRDPDRTIELADYRGGPVVLNFWASWCVPCRREMPALQATHEELGDAVTFIGINHQDDRDAAMDLLAEVGVTYSSGFDPEGKVAAG